MIPRYSRITGTGSHLPPRRVSNADLAAELARAASRPPTTGSSSAPASGRATFADPAQTRSATWPWPPRAGARVGRPRRPSEIDLIIVATSTPDMVFPSTACIVQAKLGMHGCAAFDVQAVCSGFVYALTVADAMIRTGSARHALVIGAEVFSRILDFNDRTTCVLFGDGAGAVVLEASDSPASWPPTCMPTAGMSASCACPARAGGQVLGDPLLKMDGQAVFKLAVGVLEKVARRGAGQGRARGSPTSTG
jgi:3-oxoacyl-[acyl-carrier-protein] synthase-3